MTDHQQQGISRDQWNKPKFSAPSRQKQEAAKLEQTKQQVQADTSAAEDPKVKEKTRKNQPRVRATIEKGKEWAGKFFKGFIEKERSNVKVDIQNGVIERITEQHSERLLAYGNSMIPDKPDINYLDDKFKGIVSIALAVKLVKSAPNNDQNRTRHLFSLVSPELRLPKKVIILLDQFGKSDVSPDFRLRIRNQHLCVKKFMLKGVAKFFSYEQFRGANLVNWKVDYDTVVKLLSNEDYFDKIYDAQSLDVVKSVARKHFIDISAKKNYDFKIGDIAIKVRLPDFEFKESTSASDVLEYLKNPIFKDLKPDEKGVAPMIASLVVQTAQPSWLRNKTKTLAELNVGYKDTFLAGTPLNLMLTWLGLHDLADIIEETDLDDSVSEAIRIWSARYEPEFRQIFEIEQVNFSDHGTAAQMVQMENHSFKEKENGWGDLGKYLVKRPSCTSRIKIPEHDAILGVMIGLTKNLTLTTGHDIAYDSNVHNMLSEFTKSDFKN